MSCSNCNCCRTRCMLSCNKTKSELQLEDNHFKILPFTPKQTFPRQTIPLTQRGHSPLGINDVFRLYVPPFFCLQKRFRSTTISAQLTWSLWELETLFDLLSLLSQGLQISLTSPSPSLLGPRNPSSGSLGSSLSPAALAAPQDLLSYSYGWPLPLSLSPAPPSLPQSSLTTLDSGSSGSGLLSWLFELWTLLPSHHPEGVVLLKKPSLGSILSFGCTMNWINHPISLLATEEKGVSCTLLDLVLL